MAMNRVEAINLALASAATQPLSIPSTSDAIVAAGHLDPAPLWLFVLACAIGASALSLIFGAVHIKAIVMIAAGAALGGLIRRFVGNYGGGVILQALFAGLVVPSR